MINFLAEISNRPNSSIQATPSEHSRNKNIYYLDIRPHPKDTYWTDWGGSYDTFTETQIEIYYGQFLRRVNSKEGLDESYTFFLDSDYFVYFNTPIHPWLYPSHAVKAFHVDMFLSYALNPDKPSNNILRGRNVLTKLETPSISVKLSDNISGIVLNQSFSISLSNNDGFFDDEKSWNLFNTPVYIKKSTVDNPEYEDFKSIRYGLVENTSTDISNFNVEISDIIRAMEEPVCNIILKENFSPLLELDEKIINKNIPVVYGTKKVKLQKLHDNVYMAAEYISQVWDFYNSDGSLALANYTFSSSGTINILSAPYGIPDSVRITGYENNKIGEIISDILKRKSNIPIDDSNWNIDELNRYINISPSINIAIESGNVKTNIQNILKNDMAFLIQQADRRLTLRRYGEEYAKHEIKSWTMTKNPDKRYSSAQENYFSSCKINYRFNDNNYLTFLYKEREIEAEGIYRRRVLKTFDTDLFEESDAKNLAIMLADRYLIMRQTITLPTGTDTSGFELLDSVDTEIKINDRLLSFKNKYFIKEINPAQDILTLEEIKGGI